MNKINYKNYKLEKKKECIVTYGQESDDLNEMIKKCNKNKDCYGIQKKNSVNPSYLICATKKKINKEEDVIRMAEYTDVYYKKPTKQLTSSTKQPTSSTKQPTSSTKQATSSKKKQKS